MSVADSALFEVLREGAHFCRTCRSQQVILMHAIGDFRGLAHKAAQDDRDRHWDQLLTKAETNLNETREFIEQHLAEPHEAPVEEPKPERVRVIREPKPDDRIECPACGQKVTQRDDGRINQHRAKSGTPCRRRLVSVSVEAPPINLPKQGGGMSGLSVTGECHSCGKWLPGERRFCGQCLRKRGRL